MKKVVLSLAVVAAMFVSCKEAAEKVEAAADSTVAEVETAVETVADSTAAVADSTVAKVEGAVEAAGAKVEEVKEAVKK